MQEYVFNKAELKKMIDGATDSDVISITVNFAFTTKQKVFSATILATPVKLEGDETRTESKLVQSVMGCPRPPSCD